MNVLEEGITLRQAVTERLVHASRGELVEAVHRGVIAVVDASGAVRAEVGDPAHQVTFWRSAAKPFQALPVVSSGAAEHFGFSSEELALLSGSHSGETVHVSLVAKALERIGCTPDDLICGAHPPLDPAASAELRERGIAPAVLHSNCSGKHTGMLALARHLGVPTAGYESPEHPVQRRILEAVARFAGLPADAIVVGVDGCGVPCFGTDVLHLALAFARLMDPAAIGEPDAGAARTIRDAMIAHPHIVAGTNRLDTDLMRAGRGELLAKGGASGVMCVGTAGGLGLAVKIEDGADTAAGRPSGVAAIETLRQLGALDGEQRASLAGHALPVIRTISGRAVGHARPVFELAGQPAGMAEEVLA